MRNKICIDIGNLAEAKMVGNLQAKGECHLRESRVLSDRYHWEMRLMMTNVANTQNNGHLHFVRVRKNERIVCTVPSRIESEWINMSILKALDSRVVNVSKIPSRMPNVKGLREYVVVH